MMFFLQNFVHFEPSYDLPISTACGPNTYQIMYGETSSVRIWNGRTKMFYCQIYCKNWFSYRAFYVTITDHDIESLTFSTHYLISIWTTCWWNLNKIVWYEWLAIFEKAFTPFWKTFLWHKQWFDVKVLIERLSYFIVPNITLVRHV